MNDQESKDIAKQLFDKYDENKNGVLEKKEFIIGIRELIKCLGETISLNEIVG